MFVVEFLKLAFHNTNGPVGPSIHTLCKVSSKFLQKVFCGPEAHKQKAFKDLVNNNWQAKTRTVNIQQKITIRVTTPLKPRSKQKILFGSQPILELAYWILGSTVQSLHDFLGRLGQYNRHICIPYIDLTDIDIVCISLHKLFPVQDYYYYYFKQGRMKMMISM